MLLTLNIAMFAVTLLQSGAPTPSSAVLFGDGAMYHQALERHEYWRLFAYGFLHATPVHLLGNMLCLMVWGGHLERRLGATYFILIYVATMVLAGLVGDFIHTRPYMTVGASGATSGLLGALLCLWILAKIELSASFFISNLAFNIALTFADSRINWAAHLVGFTAGLLACAVLDLVERALRHLLGAKFPEFLKLNLWLLAAVGAWLAWTAGIRLDPQSPTPVAALGLALIPVTIKLIDVVLLLRYGLAMVIAALAVANGAAIACAVMASSSALTAACRLPLPLANISPWISPWIAAGCARQDLVAVIAGGLAAGLTLLLLNAPLRRGLGDVGFIGASLRAARARSVGL
ncbi:rhomboid family intramembrane serine protease [Bradyrhizobium sp. SSBR45G]|nr:rhomboid family intramembrane serine protease [Bradyrhizobium sp. SSBR45G]GLH85166.1 rhomboid family intramembrane serine protease [Bradyrhizobium sp. SSBR45R]